MILVNRRYKIQEARILLARSLRLNPDSVCACAPLSPAVFHFYAADLHISAFVIPYDSFLLLFLVSNPTI